MTASIHGHEVLHLMLASPRTFTREQLIQEIQDRFGAEARFHTCSAEGMSAAQLVDFLQLRGKFAGPEEGFRANPDKICKD